MLENAFTNNENTSHNFQGSCSFSEHLQSTGLYNSEQDVIENFNALTDELETWIDDNDFVLAGTLLEFVLDEKDGELRKDEVTPSALHEVTQAIWFINLVENGLPVQDVEGVLSVILAHDIGEEFDYQPDDITEALIYKNPAVQNHPKLQQFSADFDLISKTYGPEGEKRHPNNHSYYSGIHTSPNATIAKMLDRAHNIMTLIGVKSIPKMNSYIASTLQLQEHFMDQYKADAGHPHPQLETYESIAHLTEKMIKISRFYTVNSGVPLPDDDELYTAMPEKAFRGLPLGLQPLFIPAERIREMHPETHLAHDPVRYSGENAEDFYELPYSYTAGDNSQDMS